LWIKKTKPRGIEGIKVDTGRRTDFCMKEKVEDVQPEGVMIGKLTLKKTMGRSSGKTNTLKKITEIKTGRGPVHMT